VQKYPVKRAGHNDYVKLVVVEDGLMKVPENAVVHIVLAEYKETAPCDNGRENVESYI
jgi:hypothetical protein